MEVSRPIWPKGSRSRSPSFKLIQDMSDLYNQTDLCNQTWFKFEVKIPNDVKVTLFTSNHTDDENDDDGTKNNTSLPGQGRGAITISMLISHFTSLKTNLTLKVKVTSF